MNNKILWKGVITKENSKELRRLYKLIGLIFLPIMFVISVLIMFLTNAPSVLKGSFTIYFIFFFTAFLYMIYVLSRKISLLIFLLILVVGAFLSPFFLHHFDLSRLSINPLLDYFILPALLTSMLGFFYFHSKNKRIASATTEMVIKNNIIKIGNIFLNPLKEKIIIHTSGKSLCTKEKDFYVIKILRDWTKLVISPTIAGGLIGGAVGGGILLGAEEKRRRKNPVNITLPLTRQQAIGFFSALNQINTSIKLIDYSKNTYPWIKNCFQKPRQQTENKGEILIIIFPRLIPGA